ncbi:ABC transporter permease [uncultured Jatrophihabitans sp.]|uniref:ABC transporter permease n=1 Tax=uncultured Jatrophihabitans sp. TaxID=1610747 RepID=UPI0035CBEA79
MSNDFVQAFTFIGDNHSYVLGRVWSHLEISGIAVGIAVAIGLPIGIVLGHLHRLSFLAINISNLGRALPSLAILVIFLPIVGVGETDVIIALVILAFPPMLTNAYVAIDGVDPETVDAAKGIGLRPWQVLLRVELPLALPLIFAGVRTAVVFVIATATLSGFFGGGGLGDIISNEASFHLSGVIGGTYVLIALAFISQFVFLGLERAVTPTGLKLQARGFRSSTQTQVLLNEAGGNVAAESTDAA